jgi:Molybdopterin-binding domain of aldehyde dehydrogenase
MRGTVHASFGAFFTANAPSSLVGPTLTGWGLAAFVEPGGIVPRAPGPDGTIGDQGQVHGAVARGLGQALTEEVSYDETG